MGLLRNFYRRWGHSDLGALLLAGDIWTDHSPQEGYENPP